MEIKTGQHCTVLGNVGSGKTFNNRNLLLPLWDRIIVLDSEEDDYPDFPNVSVKKAIRLAKSNYRFVVRVATTGNREIDEKSVEDLCQGLLQHGHDLVLLIEEATDYSDASYIPPYLRSLMRRARHRRINVIISTQRPAMLSKDYYALAIHHQFFYLSDYDVSHVKEYAPYLTENMSRIPYGSFKSIYQAPDGSIVILAPCKEYNWEARLKSRDKNARAKPRTSSGTA
jgi:DNA helicase HerA-like ATPase